MRRRVRAALLLTALLVLVGCNPRHATEPPEPAPVAADLEELGRPEDRIDDRADEREERGPGRARDEHRVLDSPARVEERPRDQRDPHDHEEENNKVHEQVEAAVRDAEKR